MPSLLSLFFKKQLFLLNCKMSLLKKNSMINILDKLNLYKKKLKKQITESVIKERI